ncbi:MAG: hypothetical protein ACR2PT_15960 [Endozoicomonas sp.]
MDVEFVSENLRDLHESDLVMRVKSDRGAEEENTIPRWRKAPGIFFPSGNYRAWLEVNQFIESIDAGEARANATLTLSCDYRPAADTVLNSNTSI